jgi:ABC-2 type transport system permease protein
MTRVIRAELVKLLRRKVLVVTAAVTVLFSVGGAAVVLAAARPASEVRGDRGIGLESLSGAGGAAEVFTTAMSFVGTFLFVVFVGAIAVEFSRGTFRTMLLRQPGRLRLLAGKLTALLLFAATALAAVEALMWVSALLLAPGRDVDTAAWTSVSAAGEALTAYGSVLLWMTGYAVLGTALAVVVRSVPVALGIGIAWAGPLEHLLQDAWGSAGRVFPGLLLEAFVAGGTEAVSASRALATVAAYVAAAAAVAGVVVTRRDVTA